MQKADSVNSLGTSIENLFILALKNGKTAFSILPKKMVDNELRIEPTQYTNIREGSYPFVSLRPKDILKNNKERQSLIPKL